MTGSLMMPDIILLKYWMHTHRDREAVMCYEIDERSQYDKLRNNGDKYLLSLLKRTCKSNEDQNSKPPVLHIPVFVKVEISDPPVHEDIVDSCQKPVFYYRNDYSYLYIRDIFHPPAA